MSSVVVAEKRIRNFTAYVKWEKPSSGPKGLYTWIIRQDPVPYNYGMSSGPIVAQPYAYHVYTTEKAAMRAADRALKELL